MKSKHKCELMCLNSASYVLKEVELAVEEKYLQCWIPADGLFKAYF